MATAFHVHCVYFRPGHDVVTIAVRPTSSLLSQSIVDLYTTQSALAARCKSSDVPWGDTEVIAEVESLLTARGAELASDDPARPVLDSNVRGENS